MANGHLSARGKDRLRHVETNGCKPRISLKDASGAKSEIQTLALRKITVLMTPPINNRTNPIMEP